MGISTSASHGRERSINSKMLGDRREVFPFHKVRKFSDQYVKFRKISDLSIVYVKFKGCILVSEKLDD